MTNNDKIIAQHMKTIESAIDAISRLIEEENTKDESKNLALVFASTTAGGEVHIHAGGKTIEISYLLQQLFERITIPNQLKKDTLLFAIAQIVNQEIEELTERKAN